MKKLLLLFYLFVGQHIFAQNVEICGTDLVMKDYYRSNPAAKAEAEAMDLKFRELVKNNQLPDFTASKVSQIYEIPVVVHVISDGSSLGSINNRNNTSKNNNNTLNSEFSFNFNANDFATRNSGRID